MIRSDPASCVAWDQFSLPLLDATEDEFAWMTRPAGR
jgi:hypothetical protein